MSDFTQKKALIVTQGCQMNARDSETLAGMLAKLGYVMTKSEDDADLVIFNTCCIRENAENRLYGNLGRFKDIKRRHKGLKIAVCGCMMQQEATVEKILKNHGFVDVIFGTHNIARFPELLHSHFETGSQIIDIWEDAGEIAEDLPSKREFGHKAGINITFGCNNFCTYCIVPYVRGRERSRKSADIVAEAQKLAGDGVIEVMLLGQNVNSYGNGDFAGLLRQVHEVAGIRRIRFMTSHPKDVSDGLVAAFRDLPKLCKHLHLPLQAGSSRVLAAMNRGYSKEMYLELIDKIRSAVPEISITTDIMVGFPTETEEDFAQTLDVARRVGFNGAFTFLYSRRAGTPADKMEQVAQDVAKERFERLLEVVNASTLAKSLEKEGRTFEVLVDSIGKKGGLDGRTDDNYLVHFNGAPELVGSLVDVKITQARTFYLNGELL